MIGTDTGRSLPGIGLGVSSDGAPLTAREVTSLRALRLDHLRVDVQPSRSGWQERLDEAAAQAAQLGCALEVALFIPGRVTDHGPDAEVAAGVAERLAGTAIARWLVFEEASAGTGTIPPGLARAVRERLGATGASSVIAGGTDGDFAELNRAWPVLDELDAITYAINPQVHASDDRSIMENVTAQGRTVETARAMARGCEIAISPVTLSARFNPAASGPSMPTPEGELPPAVDTRQMSLLGAAWTVGSLASLATAGAGSVTWYETVGWRGLIEREDGPVSARFPSEAGMTFPMYHVFADLAELREGTLLDVASSAPRSLTGLAVRRDGRINGIVANLTPDRTSVVVGPLAGEIRYRVLDVTTATVAASDPDAFRRSGSAIEAAEGGFQLDLDAYGVVVFGAFRQDSRG